MKLRRWIALALVGLAWANVGWAQSVVQDGQSTRGVQQSTLGGHMVRSDSTQDANTGDGSGNQYTAEAYPDRTFLKKYQSIIQSTLYHTYSRISTGVLKGPQADSSSAKDVLGAKHLGLAISYTLDDSTRAALLLIEVRGHLTQNTDSVNTFPWTAWGAHKEVYPTAIAAVIDTVGSMPTDNTFVSTHVDTVNAGPTERPVWLSQTGPFRYKWVNLVNPDTGEWFSAPYVSVRVRVIRTYGISVANLGTQAPPTTINIDLLGWR